MKSITYELWLPECETPAAGLDFLSLAARSTVFSSHSLFSPDHLPNVQNVLEATAEDEFKNLL